MNELTVQHEGCVAHITLGGAGSRCELNDSKCRGLICQLTEEKASSAIRCVLIRSAGAAFTVGWTPGKPMTPTDLEICEQMLVAVDSSPVPVVAAVQGAVAGLGIALLSCCHAIVASQSATFAFNEIRMGGWPLVGSAHLLRVFGERRLTELSLTGRLFSASEAQQIGLVHELVPAFELNDRSASLADQLAQSSQTAVRQGLSFLRKSRGLSPESIAKLGHSHAIEVLASADYLEGQLAALEKRRPVWEA